MRRRRAGQSEQRGARGRQQTDPFSPIRLLLAYAQTCTSGCLTRWIGMQLRGIVLRVTGNSVLRQVFSSIYDSSTGDEVHGVGQHLECEDRHAGENEGLRDPEWRLRNTRTGRAALDMAQDAPPEEVHQVHHDSKRDHRDRDLESATQTGRQQTNKKVDADKASLDQTVAQSKKNDCSKPVADKLVSDMRRHS